MTSTLRALRIGAIDPERLARFWAGVLDRPLLGSADAPRLGPADDAGFAIEFFPLDRPKIGANRTHLDLTSSSLADQQQTVSRALELGGRHLDIGQLPDEEHVVLADPEDNEFCVIQPGNAFLAGCGFVGAVNGDGTQQVGYFWSEALGWPLVWDQDEETAIRSPLGGAKLTWGGPPVNDKHGTNRFQLELAASDGVESEVDRLVSLGARRLGAGEVVSGRVEMLDPDSNEFAVSEHGGI